MEKAYRSKMKSVTLLQILRSVMNFIEQTNSLILIDIVSLMIIYSDKVSFVFILVIIKSREVNVMIDVSRNYHKQFWFYNFGTLYQRFTRTIWSIKLHEPYFYIFLPVFFFNYYSFSFQGHSLNYLLGLDSCFDVIYHNIDSLQ